MALTTPDNIWTPNAGEQYALTTDLATTASSIQSALTQKANYGVGTTAEMNAAVSRYPNGAMWYNTTNSTEYRRVGGVWVEEAEDDTGWVTLTPMNRWVLQSNRTIRVRRIGHIVNLVGQVTASNNPSDTTIATLPEQFRPPQTLIVANYFTSPRYVGINSTGAITTEDTSGIISLVSSWMVD